jgi:hypothetical protein
MKKLYNFLILLITGVLCLSSDVLAQKKIIKKLFSNDQDSSRSSSFLPLPAAAYSQETGLEFGVLPLYSFYTDREDYLTRNSSVTGIATYTTKKQVNLQLKTDYWTPQNRYHYNNDIRYKDFPFYFYGIGSNTLEADKQNVTQKNFRFIVQAEKKTGGAAYTGFTSSYEDYRFQYANEFIDANTPLFFYGKEGGKVLYLGLSQVLDSRNNNTYK